MLQKLEQHFFYFFILGRIPELSRFELIKFAQKILFQKFQVFAETREFVILETDEEISLEFWQKQLGGIVKCGEIINLDCIPQGDQMGNFLVDFFSSQKNSQEIVFALSVYQDNTFDPSKKINFNFLKRLAMFVKKSLKSQGRRTSFFISPDLKTPTGTILKGQVLIRGSEMIFFSYQNKTLLGATRYIQSIQEEAALDFDRPYHSMERGLTPPKLVKIMLNIAAFSFDSQLLDPFCGSGTFLCQAALMGYRHLIGSDLSPEAIEGAKKNFLWLQQKFQLSSDIDAKFFSADAREIDKIISSGTIDAIVSEPYLGPRRMLRGNEEMRNEIDMISHLYLDFFLVAKKILRNNGRIVIVLPIFVSQGKDYSLDILPQILAQGWRQEALSDSARRSLIYFRPGQLVKREIMSFSF